MNLKPEEKGAPRFCPVCAERQSCGIILKERGDHDA